MDPNETWTELGFALARDDRRDAREFAEALRNWLDRGGFLPTGVTREEAESRLALVFDPYGDKRDGVDCPQEPCSACGLPKRMQRYEETEWRCGNRRCKRFGKS